MPMSDRDSTHKNHITRGFERNCRTIQGGGVVWNVCVIRTLLISSYIRLKKWFFMYLLKSKTYEYQKYTISILKVSDSYTFSIEKQLKNETFSVMIEESQ